MLLETIKSPGVAHLSYIVGDGRKAAVIDPRRDWQVYVDIARRAGMHITHIFETHRNEDYAIGSVELASVTGAEIYHGEGGVQFAYGNYVSEGDSFDLASLRLSVLVTPGHTLESISLALADTDFSDDPVAVFTGDALFVGDVGRTDFFPGREEEVAGMLYDSIFGKLLPLGDHVILHPAHGAGSVCGSRMADREFSTLGYERAHNSILRMTDRDEFVAFKSAEHHYAPPYFKRMEHFNAEGSPPVAGLPEPAPMSATGFADAMDEGMFVLDVRSPEAFGGAHIPGSLNVPMSLLLAYVGWFLPYDTPIGLVVDSREQMLEARTGLLRIGYDDVVGYLFDGMLDWETDGRAFEGVPQVYIGELERRYLASEEMLVLDVRKRGEFERTRLEGAVNIFVGELPDRLDEIPATRPIVTFCGGGPRASIASSILLRAGFEGVETCLGSMAACFATACPMRE